MTPAITDHDTPAPAEVAALRNGLSHQRVTQHTDRYLPVAHVWQGRINVYVGSSWQSLTLRAALDYHEKLGLAIAQLRDEQAAERT